MCPPRVFAQRVRKMLKTRGMRFALVHPSQLRASKSEARVRKALKGLQLEDRSFARWQEEKEVAARGQSIMGNYSIYY